MTRKRLFTTLLNPNRPRLVALIAFCLIMAVSSGCTALRNIRGYLYCEIILNYDDTSEVWGTQGLSQCPNEKWEALVPEAIRADYNATGIIMNGPRYFVINGASGVDMPKDDTRIYGELEMRKLATLNATESAPYVPVTVLRTYTWEFQAVKFSISLFPKAKSIQCSPTPKSLIPACKKLICPYSEIDWNCRKAGVFYQLSLMNP